MEESDNIQIKTSELVQQLSNRERYKPEISLKPPMRTEEQTAATRLKFWLGHKIKFLDR